MKIILAILVSLFFAACGSSGTCSYDITTIANGSSSSAATNYWSCQANGSVWSFQFFTDGTGWDSQGGSFAWKQTGCRDVQIENAGGLYYITDITGSADSGIIDLTQGGLDVSCVLISGSPT